jgi:hypothetical protein
MNDVLRPFLESFVIVYLYDILVYISPREDHVSHLMQVLETVKKHRLLDKLNTSEFDQQSLMYFGYVISGGELKIDPTKMEDMRLKWLVPTNFTEFRISFREKQYLWKFIASFLVVVMPL